MTSGWVYRQDLGASCRKCGDRVEVHGVGCNWTDAQTDARRRLSEACSSHKCIGGAS